MISFSSNYIEENLDSYIARNICSKFNKSLLDRDLVIGEFRSFIHDIACIICFNIVWDPISCENCHTIFCRDCMNQWLEFSYGTCPNRCEYREMELNKFSKKLLSKIKLLCINRDKGCKAEVNYESYETHVNSLCQFAKVNCVGCQNAFYRKDIRDHLYLCEEMYINCEKCKKSMKKKDLKQHISSQCPEVIYNCKYCAEKFKRKFNKYHRMHCLEWPVTCNNCGVKIKRKLKEKHMTSLVCSFRTKRRFLYMQNDMKIYRKMLGLYRQELVKSRSSISGNVNRQSLSMLLDDLDNSSSESDSFTFSREDSSSNNENSDLLFGETHISNTLSNSNNFIHRKRQRRTQEFSDDNTSILINNIEKDSKNIVFKEVVENKKNRDNNINSSSISLSTSASTRNTEKLLDEIISLLEEGVEQNISKLAKIIPISAYYKIRNCLLLKSADSVEDISIVLYDNKIFSLVLKYFPSKKEFGIKLEEKN